MKEVNNDLKNIMEELEKNIRNPEDLEYIKSKFSNIFLEILNNVTIKMDKLEQKQKELEDTINQIEKELFIEDDFTFEIVCPYCNTEFETDMKDDLTEVKCPECGNKIELEWNGEEDLDCMGNCSGCSGCSEEDDM